MKIKLSIKKTSVFVHNVLFNILFFFNLRCLYLNVFSKNSIGKGVALHTGIYFFDINKLSIGNNSTINHGCYVDNRMGVNIGNNVNISHDCKIYTMGHNIDSPMAESNGGPVVIEDDVWIFPNCLIMPNVKVAKGAVIYPGSVVTKNVEAYNIVGGNPARFIRERSHEIDYMLDNRVWFAR